MTISLCVCVGLFVLNLLCTVGLDKPWTESEAAAIVRSVLEAVAGLHEARVLHLNVTTENILLDSASGGLVVEGLTLSRMAPTDEPIKSAIAGGTLQVSRA